LIQRHPDLHAEVMRRYEMPADPRLVIATTTLTSSLAFIDGSVVNVALPAIGRSFHANAIGLQAVGRQCLFVSLERARFAGRSSGRPARPPSSLDHGRFAVRYRSSGVRGGADEGSAVRSPKEISGAGLRSLASRLLKIFGLGATCRPSTSAPTTRWALEVRPAHDPVREYSQGRFTPLVLRQIQPAADNAVARIRSSRAASPSSMCCRRSCQIYNIRS